MAAANLVTVGLKAMAASYAGLQTTGHNIANASVAGYSRQQAELATAKPEYSGSGYFGRGVDVTTVSRAHDEFLTREAASAQSLSAMDGARLNQLKKLENVFQPGAGGLGDAVTGLFGALVDLSTRPADLATRQVVLGRAGDLASRFSNAAATFDDIQSNVNGALQAQVADVNRLAQAVASANQRITAAQAAGQPPNDLLDERDRLIGELSGKVQTTRIAGTDGSISVFIGGGLRLVSGASAQPLQWVADSADPQRSAVVLKDSSGTTPLEGDSLGGGSIAGLLRFQNHDLVDGRNLVGQLAAAIGGAVNAQQLRGISLQQPLGSAATGPLFQMGSPQALPRSTNATSGTGAPLGSVALSISDPTALRASDYDLRESPSSPGSWQLTRLSDGVVTTVNSGDVVDGVQIDIVNAQPGDRFLLKPVGPAASGMARLLDDPLDLAAASALTATTPSSNAGTAVVTGLTLTASPLPFPGTSDTLSFAALVPPVGGNDFTYTSSLTGVSTPWHAGQPVVGGNGYSLTLTGVPANGDVLNVDPTPANALSSSNGNANAMLALRDAALANGHTATDAWSQALANVGVRVQSAQSAAEISSGVATQTEESRSAQSGVNLDEEASRLIQYQQSYQAAAKVLQVAQSIFDTLLQAAGR
jgi:flagellar hook-associated protein 1 FlgK